MNESSETQRNRTPILSGGAVLVGVLISLASALAHGQSTATITIQADQPGVAISSNLFGIFFEEINFAGDGGLYGELVRNRSFANSSSPDYWSLVTQGTAAGQMNVDTSRALNTNTTRSLKLTMQSGTGSVGAANSGYWGLALQAGATYDLNFYASAASGFSEPISARLESADGSQLYAQVSFNGVASGWQHFAAPLAPSRSDTGARLVLSIADNGTIWLDEVSLFPRTSFGNRTNGLRLDLANMLAALKPSFLRYPGGNFIESYNVTNAVRWKNTIGEVASRPGHLNDSWGYWSTDGYGLDEAFRQCEDMGMELLYDINCGLMLGYNGSTNNTVPLDQMGPWVQDALDLIEYANGDTNGGWGALRAANGHPAPYNLKYLEIGNENGGSYYNDRYTLFYDAIKAKYPKMRLISPVWGGSPWSRPVEIQDEHYYLSPAAFISYATKYDSYSRSGPEVFVGEYAVTSGYGTNGNLAAALGEAAFMTGLERNSDIVQMASYAPLFANVNGIQWHPDLIYFDGSRCFGTPSYYVQQMFSCNRGDRVLPVSVVVSGTATNPCPWGAIGLGSWNTSVQYSNVVVTSNGITLYKSDFVNAGTIGWNVYNGSWNASSGVYQQTAIATDCRSTAGNTNWANYTLSLRARKISGSEGFLIVFNWQDDNNWTWLNLGGWGNTLDGIEQNVDGSKTILGTRVADNIKANQWYDILVVIAGAHVQCFLNGNLVQDATYSLTAPSGLFASSSYNNASGQVIVKAVNPYSQPLATTFNFSGIKSIDPTATLIQLTSGNPADENSLASPTNVFPTTSLVNLPGTNFVLTFPGNSLSVLRLQAAPAVLAPNGLTAAASGWQVNLNWTAPLGASNYKIKRALNSAGPYTTIATVSDTTYVDNAVANGGTYFYVVSAVFASGEGPVSPEVAAKVGAARLAWLKFDETSGTSASDATGNHWSGTLVNGPVWSTGCNGGAVIMNGAAQYVSLPSGITDTLSNFTIAAWVNLDSLSPWARIFDFGSGTSSYMFLTPQSGSGNLRFAISIAGYESEQELNAPGAVPTNGWHHFAVTRAANLGILYLDGLPIATNAAMTLAPASLARTTQNWIGRSQFSADPYLDGRVDDFMIFDGALGAMDVASFVTPLSAPANVAATPGNAQATLTWNASPNAAGYNIKRSGTSGGPYQTVATNAAGITFCDSSLANWQTYYYVVTAVNAVGESPPSAQVSVAPVAPTAPQLRLGIKSNQLQVLWPEGYTGWRLEMQTNKAGDGLSTNWFVVQGSMDTNQMFWPSNSGDGFLRLVFP